MNTFTEEDVARFQSRVFDWWKDHKRVLPWRENHSPYNVTISEIMLQQTQVSRVIPKYYEFLSVYPDFASLASADTESLLKVWRGLGYNRRALWLREMACELEGRDGFPMTPEELQKLKGIGPYTSKSILIFAFNLDLAAVDTNIRRVLIASGFASESDSQKELQKVADTILPHGRSRDWHNALMDYGSLVLTAARTGIRPTTRQPRFVGSTRQVRGRILQMLTEQGELNIESLLRHITTTSKPEKLHLILEQLIEEGFIERDANDVYRIAR